MEKPPAVQQPVAVEKGQNYAAQQTAIPNNASSGVPGGEHVYPTPMWVTVVRGGQLLIGLIIMVLAGILVHGVLLNAWAFALVCGLFTWIVVTYALVAEKVTSARNLYNVYAILALDFLMAVFWLASMGANAHTRASFRYSVNVLGCYDDGSNIDAHSCITTRNLEKRKSAIASQRGLAYMSAVAGLSALELIFFVATLVFLAMEWKKNRPTGPTPSAVEMNNVGGSAAYVPPQQFTPAPAYQPAPPQPMQPPYTGQPMPPQQQQPQQFAPSPVSSGYASPVQPQYTGQQQTMQPQFAGHQQQAPYKQVPTPGPQGVYQELPSQHGQPMYSPSTSPAPQGQHVPPAQPYSPQPQELPPSQQFQQYQQYPPQH